MVYWWRFTGKCGHHLQISDCRKCKKSKNNSEKKKTITINLCNDQGGPDHAATGHLKCAWRELRCALQRSLLNRFNVPVQCSAGCHVRWCTLRKPPGAMLQTLKSSHSIARAWSRSRRELLTIDTICSSLLIGGAWCIQYGLGESASKRDSVILDTLSWAKLGFILGSSLRKSITNTGISDCTYLFSFAELFYIRLEFIHAIFCYVKMDNLLKNKKKQTVI